MLRFSLAFCLILGLAGLSAAQELEDIRAPDINAETPEGELVVEAAAAESVEERIPALEELLEKFPETRYRGYAWLQLQGAYVQTKNHEKAIEVGKKLLELVPEDVEVRHNLNQSLIALARWDELLPMLVETRPYAEKEAAKPKPEDPYEDEEALWQGQVDYAKGVVQYVEWAFNAGLQQQSDPQKMLKWMETLKEQYPSSKYLAGLEPRYVMAYQRMGDFEKAVEYMRKAVDNGSTDAAYFYTLAEHAMGKQENDTAKAYAARIMPGFEARSKPENLSEEQWEAHKKKFSAYANYVLGRLDVMKNNKPGFRSGRAQLLKAQEVIKAEGGQNYHVLAYFLGLCYVKLDIAGDNIKKAAYWMNEAAKTPGSFQAQAKQTLGAIRAAQ